MHLGLTISECTDQLVSRLAKLYIRKNNFHNFELCRDNFLTADPKTESSWTPSNRRLKLCYLYALNCFIKRMVSRYAKKIGNSSFKSFWSSISSTTVCEF